MVLCMTPEAAPKRARISSIRDGMMVKRRKIDTSPCTHTAIKPIVASPSPSSFTRRSPSSLSFFASNFITIAALGEGDFGQVKQVQKKDSFEEFALKVSKVDRTKVKTGLNYTMDHLKEIRSHSSLASHPNLVQFHQAWKEAGHAYLLMELCSDSLDGYWRKKNELAQEEIKSALNDMLRALSILSSLNIVHLDIKPQNILRNEKGVFKLADFGTAVDLSKDSCPEEFGDGRYAAPEILNGQFTPKADLFSLAITISQVSVPASSPLTADEWSGMKEDGHLPDRVAIALPGMAAQLQSMLLPLRSRPSVEDLCKEENKFENHSIRQAINTFFLPRNRHSLSSSCERKMRENKSPLIKKSAVLFHTDATFYEMEKPKTRKRSLEMRRPIRFDIDD